MNHGLAFHISINGCGHGTDPIMVASWKVDSSLHSTSPPSRATSTQAMLTCSMSVMLPVNMTCSGVVNAPVVVVVDVDVSGGAQWLEHPLLALRDDSESQ